MSLIQRYINTVVSYLPEEMKKDVPLELESNIMDMLPDEATEVDTIKVLESLGSPSQLAQQYNSTKRYLIGPAVYDKYISVLKLVLTIVAITITVIIGFKWILTGNALENTNAVMSISAFMSETIATIAESLLQAVFWVTLVFVLIDRNKVIDGNSLFKSKAWTVADLPPENRNDRSKISRVKTIISICFTIFFTFLIYLQPNFIRIAFVSINNVTKYIPVWDPSRLSSYFSYILILAIFSVSLSIWKLVVEHWSVPMAITNTLLNILVCILVIVMVTDSQLWTDEIKNIKVIWSNSFKIAIAVFVGINIWDSVEGFLKCRK